MCFSSFWRGEFAVIRFVMKALWVVTQLVHVWSLPQPFRLFEVGEAEGHPPNVRHFHHHQDHSFEDGSEFSLHWDVDTDPDTLLELDLEHTKGVKILSCGQDHLVLQVPQDLLKRLNKLEHVTASHFLHSCKHLENENLYHRILKIQQVTQSSTAPTAIVEVHTKELQTVQEVFRSCRMYLHVMPSGAKSRSPRLSSLRGERRLQQKSFLDFLKDGVNSLGEVQGGQFNMKTGFKPDQANEQQGNTFFNLNNPQEKDNFAWNWKYQANSTENPQYKYTFPGGTTWLRLFKPYVNASLGFTMNLSSHMPDITQAPHVMVDVVVRSYADMDLDIGAAANFDKDRSSSIMQNVLETIPVPFFSKLKADTEMFMRPLKFHIGGTPITVTPGMSVNMKIFHIGQMKGTMRVGLKTIVNCTGSMHFDTTFGEQHNFSTEMLNVSFTSPTWLLFTQHFQLGVELAPNFWIKGGMGILRDMEMGLGLRPYINISVEKDESALGSKSEANELAIYPYRIMGLPYGRSFAVKISANGRYKETAVQMSTGVVEFQNKVEIFEFPPLTEQQLMTEQIKVEILEDGKEPAKAAGTVVCKKLVNGMCDPHPTEVKMLLDGKEVIVQLGIFFQANALGMLEANMQSVSLRFPMVTFNPPSQPGTEALHKYLAEHLDCLQLLLYHSGHTYSVNLEAKFPEETSLFNSNTLWELGPSFTELWLSPPITMTNLSTNEKRLQNLVQVVCGDKVIAQGQLLQTQVTEEKPISNVEDLDSEQQESMNTIPSQVMLFDPQNPAAMVGSAQIELDIMPCEYGAFWVQPFQADSFVATKVYTFAWATHGAVPTDWYRFNISIVEEGHNGQLSAKFLDRECEVQCSHDPRVKVHRYYGGNLPCVFEHQVTIPESAAGKTVVALAGWSDAMDYLHFMESPPFFVVSQGRRLNATNVSVSQEVMKNDESVGFGFQSEGHKEGLSHEAAAAIAELQSHCSPQPLEYSLGMGLNYQQLLKNVPMGAGMGGAGGATGIQGYFTPDGSYITRPYPLWVLGQQNEGELSDLLPRSACAGGVCKGMMLGCQKTKVTPIDIPKIAYKFSRTYNWIPHVGPSARHVIAYGLMVLPAAVKEAGREAKQVEATMKQNNETMTSRRLSGLAFKTPAGGEFKVETLDDMEDDWSQHGPFDEMIVQISHPMHYHISDAVMRYLMHVDAFRGLEDGREATHGPIKIVGYELLDSPRMARKKATRLKQATALAPRSPVPVKVEQGSQTELWEANLRGAHSSTLAASCFVGLGIATLLAMALLSIRRQRGYDTLPAASSGDL
ncbi:unnamed protein product [Durusdinium trenchii]|uniref:Uncharacterized protein n=1 Tax=Durusdinium trenchii TaxID=1381693 RepID=A0ABP0JZ23_9DINO